MALNDLNKHVNISGANTYMQQRERIMREAAQAETRKQAIDADRAKQEISHARLHKQTLEGRIMQLKSDVFREKDPKQRAFKEKELHRLINDKTHIEGEIITLQGRERAGHNIRYNNPHYF